MATRNSPQIIASTPRLSSRVEPPADRHCPTLTASAPSSMDVIQSRPLPPLPASPPQGPTLDGLSQLDMSSESICLPREPLFLDLVQLASSRSPDTPSSTEDTSTDMSTDFTASDIVYDVSTTQAAYRQSHELTASMTT